MERVKNGPPARSQDKRSRLGHAAVRALERRGEVSAPRVLVKLQQIAESNSPDRVAAAKVILAYTLGPPKQTVSLELGPSPAQVLMEIARERRKRIEGAQTVEVLVDPDRGPES